MDKPFETNNGVENKTSNSENIVTETVYYDHLRKCTLSEDELDQLSDKLCMPYSGLLSSGRIEILKTESNEQNVSTEPQKDYSRDLAAVAMAQRLADHSSANDIENRLKLSPKEKASRFHDIRAKISAKDNVNQ